MTRRFRRVHVAMLMAAVVTGAAVGSRAEILRAQQPSRTVWDGVYTAEQARRGEATYTEACAACHGPTLAGADVAPGLAGGEFSANWDSLTLGDLFERTRVSMPANSPDSLSRQQYADVIAYMLQVGQFPAGSMELSTKTEVLKDIKFQALKP